MLSRLFSGRPAWTPLKKVPGSAHEVSLECIWINAADIVKLHLLIDLKPEVDMTFPTRKGIGELEVNLKEISVRWQKSIQLLRTLSTLVH